MKMVAVKKQLAAPCVEREVYAKWSRLSPGKARRRHREKGCELGWGCEQRVR